MEVHQDVFLHCNMIHYVDEIQKSLRQKKKKKLYLQRTLSQMHYILIRFLEFTHKSGVMRLSGITFQPQNQGEHSRSSA